jgi:hypothetical protein
MMAERRAAHFVERLEAYRSDDELWKIQRYFKTSTGEYGEGDRFTGVRMGQVFALAKEFVDMPIDEIETLLESPRTGTSTPCRRCASSATRRSLAEPTPVRDSRRLRSSGRLAMITELDG